jgi:hypothetical protein
MEALGRINPEIQKKLPRRETLMGTNLPAAPNFDALVSEWQKAYETLKKEYEKK